jgi:glutaminyl-peptide cyclotransferase
MSHSADRPAGPKTPVSRFLSPLLRQAAGGFALLALVAVGGLLMLHPWSGEAEGTPKKELFAADRDGGGEAVAIDTKRTMGYLEALCKIGPRISGSEGMKKQQELIEKHFKDLGARVEYQHFTARQRSVGREVEMANLVVSWHPEKARRVILCSHYDTRPIADEERDPRRWREPFVSANDGGSGVALLMELGHHMKDLPVEVGVDFVFFDGEEYIHDRDRDIYFFGSRHFGQEYRRLSRRHPEQKVYVGAILLDMVGGKNARFPIEQTSWGRARDLVRVVWGIAEEVKAPAFRSDAFSRHPVLDDHVALNDNGIPAIDIIDFDYPHWHKLSDVPANCSGDTLAQVGRVVSLWLQRAR